jgi:hypothetical protein
MYRYSNIEDLEMKIYGFNQMCSTVRTAQNKQTRKDTQIKFYKAMAEPG